MPEEGIELSEKNSLMSHEEVIAIAKTFVEMGVEKIRLTGGEPLIKKNIEKIVKELSVLPINLGVTTNGILLDKYFNLFKECGVTDINISLDTLSRESFLNITRRDYFDRVMDNINMYEANGFNVKINNVIIKGVNDHEVLDFIELTKDKNIAIRFIEFMPFDGNNWDTKKVISLKQIIDAAELKYTFENIIKLPSKKNGTAKNFQIKGYKGSFGVISTVSNPFCDSCNRIRLTANGRIKNCLFSSGETDLLEVLRREGDLKKTILEGVYHKKAVRGGMAEDVQFFDEKNYNQNRSMTAIGG
jgi:cyclic pyranopterin phosphate synthase